MADADIIDFGRRGHRPRPDPDPEPDSTEDPPPTLPLGALLSELADLIRQALNSLRSVPFEQVRGLAEDPLRTLAAPLARSAWTGRHRPMRSSPSSAAG